jgi:uncharacterized membrane protein
MAALCAAFFGEYVNLTTGLLLGAPMAADWLAQEYFNRASTNPRRFLTGLLCGIGFGSLYFFGIRFLFSYFTKGA